MTVIKQNHIKRLISSKTEGEYWLFRKDWQECQPNLLHDIVCLANTVNSHDCLVIIGVSENGEFLGLDAPPAKLPDIAGWLQRFSFAGDNYPEIKVERVEHEGKTVDAVIVSNSYKTPFFLKETQGNLIGGHIYSRTGTENTPINGNSTFEQIELLWKKRFMLLSPPIVQAYARLRCKSAWYRAAGAFYDDYNPEFVVDIMEEDGSRPFPEFYSYNQESEITHYCDVNIQYRETVLDVIRTVILNDGVYHTPVPMWGFICDREYDGVPYKYRYMLMDSPEVALQNLLYNEDDPDEQEAKAKFDEVILYFRDEDEHRVFTDMIERTPQIVIPYINEAKKREYNVPIDGVEGSKELLVTAFAFKSLLDDLREGTAK